MRELKIYETAKEVPLKRGSPAVLRFGGINLYGTTEKNLLEAVAAISQSILRVGEKSDGLNTSLYKYLVEQDLGIKLSKRVFSALLGRQLRDGNLDAIICEGPKGTMFRVVLAKNQLSEFQKRVEEVRGRLLREQNLAISGIRDAFFGRKQKGSWTQAMFVAARLVWLGLAVFDDRDTISMPAMIRHALLPSDR